MAMRSNPTEPSAGVTPRRFKPYPAYKDSGIEWLGQIPAHWRVRRLKYLASLNPESLAEDADPTLEIIYVDIGGVDSLGRIVEKHPLVFASAPSRARRLVRDGDVIVSTVRTYLRAIAAISTPEPDLVVSTGFAVVRPGDDLITGYAAHALRAPFFVELVVANSKGVSFPAINETEMATFGLAVPPPLEQSRVAAFLDRETARIDALVAEKKRLIDLLNEQRTSLITGAVTKGLDPSVPMRDSSLEWLESVPAHWRAFQLRRVVRKFVDYRGATPKKTPSGVRLVTASNIKGGRIDFSLGEEFIGEEDYETWMSRGSPERGDVLITTEAPLGEAAQVSEEGIALAQRIILLKAARELLDSDYLKYVFLSRYGRATLESRATGSTAVGIKASHLKAIPLVLPPIDEQRTIVATLDCKTQQISSLVGIVEEAVVRLQEYRTALISAAVTGKIDVREEVA